MDYLIKQSRRVKFSDPLGPSTNILQQKTTSFREEKKRLQNWFGKQMNQDYDPNEVEQATAVAAATYAVISVTDSSISGKTKLGRQSQPSFTRIQSQKEATKVSIPEADTSKIEDTEVSRPQKQSSEIQEEQPRTAASPERTAVEVVGPSTSVTRTPTFTDKPKVNTVPTFADDQLSTRREIKSAESVKLKPDPVPDVKMSKPAHSPAQMNRHASTEADSWERAELAKIKNRYEEVEARIVSWENEKKKNSRRRLDKTESKLERKRLKALERFRSEIDDINQIVEEARSKAKERRKYDELKAKEKAKTYRKTGKPPTNCFCF